MGPARARHGARADAAFPLTLQGRLPHLAAYGAVSLPSQSKAKPDSKARRDNLREGANLPAAWPLLSLRALREGFAMVVWQSVYASPMLFRQPSCRACQRDFGQ